MERIKEKSTSEETNLERPPTIRPSGVDFDVARLVAVFRQPKIPRLGKRAIMFVVDLDTDMVEFLEYATQVKGSEVSQPATPVMAYSR
jgi:hypothetical protein